MTTASLLDLWRGALIAAITVSAPFLVAGLVVGVVVAVVQTATQLQEAILTFVPKLAAAGVVLALAGHWVLDRLGRYATEAITAQAAVDREVVDEVPAPAGAPGPAP